METMENPAMPKEVKPKEGKLGRPRSHGMTGTPTYTQWALMKQSCTNPKVYMWKYIGEKGIKFCDRWGQFRNFLADMGEKPEGSTLQRRDRDKDFTPSNCFWQREKAG